MKAAVAGTFDILHDGHKALFERAFSLSDNVVIGITSDRMASVSRNRINPFYLRKKAVSDYLKSINRTAELFMIDDMYGPKDIMEKVDVLVVSEETLENGKKVAEWRSSFSDNPLELSVVSLVKRTDGMKLSSSDIMDGTCSRSGNVDSVDIAVGSLNPVKIEAVRNVMERIYGNVRIFAVDSKSGVPEQPFEDETVKGAINRAKGALGNHTMAVGIEAGVFERYDGLYDVQHCAVIDKDGKITIGIGSGFRYPDKIAELVRNGKTVGEAMNIVYTHSDVGKEQGAIGVLSKGLLDRRELTEQSVLNAMLPRIWDE